VLNGGVPIEFPPLSADEADYLDSLTGAVRTMQRSAAAAWAADGDSPDLDVVITTFWDAIEVLDEALRTLEAPEGFRSRHDELGLAIAALLEVEAEVRTAVAAATDQDDPSSAVDLAFESSGANRLADAMVTACNAIASESLRRGGPDVCSPAG
jgi:hypothetical protein